MSLLTPNFRFARITDIPMAFFAERHREALILDVDNTLAADGAPDAFAGVEEWLQSAREAGLRLMLLSNNTPVRVRPFAEKMGLPYEADAHKPAADAVLRACGRLGALPSSTALIGDQIFTDIWAGNRAGLLTVYVDPLEPESHWFFRLKRLAERLILR